MQLSQFEIKRHSEKYWRVTFNNPPINLVNPETIQELQAIVDQLEADPSIQVVVFDSAHPDYFFARYDLKRAADTSVAPGPSGLPAWIDFTTRLSKMAAISIALIRGRTRGGGSEFALACDMRFASMEKAVFGQPEVPAGVIPGGGAIERLPLLMGRARALEVVIGGDDFDADLAERYGWINRALPDDELDDFVENLALRISTFDRTALGDAKRLLNRDSLPDNSRLQEAQDAFFEATQRPQVALIGKKAVLTAATVGADEFESRLGYYLGRLPDI
ncbi:enoyl-CoA hydratase/isomerase family protein [Pseudomonas aeruginosa]|uniref:enoyl-CoA hydratase/isomerase family protein n=2 Tax=Pseudomonas aeruginosa TaxID=287 RepID=UPI000936075F|nr:enoyl-CoA hydratase/isomerase family protein [Pseudomonas aeruginosa]EKJ8518162.1 enoyl-CoA hydratase/isomerase family protein [Pseudomonas aeruginosa]ELK7308570.1 enoyl-CoA hydratase/isomerase family protein [Pseudomonas aeruginosa]ELP0276289.1 enoyl-CoA hydratase/isomerase family protein [Pseudomonas aeruginosa]MBG4807678.1 enoyl-CoA hydratase/isomerase family protein [Pseudomonas aeruginosa]MBG5029219.1 enoyl-CoA hydratase/isomerase family protein [Pseudomonas aeruginosa]